MDYYSLLKTNEILELVYSKMFIIKHFEKLKHFFSVHSDTHHLDFTINVITVLDFNIYPSGHFSPLILFLNFQSSLQ
mgnify:CR=1 FL=1